MKIIVELILFLFIALLLVNIDWPDSAIYKVIIVGIVMIYSRYIIPYLLKLLKIK